MLVHERPRIFRESQRVARVPHGECQRARLLPRQTSKMNRHQPGGGLIIGNLSGHVRANESLDVCRFENPSVALGFDERERKFKPFGLELSSVPDEQIGMLPDESYLQGTYVDLEFIELVVALTQRVILVRLNERFFGVFCFYLGFDWPIDSLAFRNPKVVTAMQGRTASGFISLQSTHKLARHNRRVMPAEPERIIDHRVDRQFPRCIRHIIQIAFGIGLLVIDRRRNDVRLDGLGADGHFHRAGRAEHVTGRALGGADGQFPRVITENRFDRLRFADVALRRRSAVGVDVGNVRGIQAGGTQSHPHAARRAFAPR